jgi:hypothetical protein
MAQEQAKSSLAAGSPGAKDESKAAADAKAGLIEGKTPDNPQLRAIERTAETQKKTSLTERLQAEQRKAQDFKQDFKDDDTKPLELTDVVSSAASGGNAGKPVTRIRRPAGPAHRRIATAANDDLPSIGGLIFALQQKPSRSPFLVALVASVAWFVIGGFFAFGLISAQLKAAGGAPDLLANPSALTAAVGIVLPIAIFWFLALLVWRAQELRLMASAMTEVAVRLAEPDKLAEQSVASLGQTIRRQVAAMNDAISRAIGRAGELEALVHNEVAALERSYSENEIRVRSLISELASEREALSNNSERVSETLKGVSAQVARDISAVSGSIDKKLAERGQQLTELLVARSTEAAEQVQKAQSKVVEHVPALLDRLTKEQTRLTNVIEGAAKNLQALESVVGERTTALDKTMKERTEALQTTLATRVKALETSVAQGALTLDKAIGQGALTLDKTFKERTDALTATVTQSAGVLDKTFKDRTDALAATANQTAATLSKSLTERTDAFTAAINQSAGALDKTFKDRTDGFAATANQTAATLSKSLTERTDAFTAAINQSAGALDKTFKDRTDGFAATVDQSATSLSKSLKDRTDAFASTINQNAIALDKTLAERTDSFANSMATRSKALEHSIVNHAAAVDKALADRAHAVTTSIVQHTTAIDRTLAERTHAVTTSLAERLKSIDATFGHHVQSVDHMLSEHAKSIEGRFGQQSAQLNQVLAHNSNLMRQTADQVGAQSKEAVGILTGQTQNLRDVSRGLLDQIHSLTQRFENQGQAILTAAKALDSSNTKIDSILEGRHQSIIGLLHTVSTKAQDLDGVMRSYAGMVEGALVQAETRAKQVGSALARDTAGQAQQALAQIERLREEAQAHTARAVGDLKGSFETVITQIGRQLEQMRGQFDQTSHGMREAARETASDLDSMRQEMQRRMEALPQQTAQATAAIRKALAEQLREIEAITPVLTRAAQQSTGTDPYRQASLPRGQSLPPRGDEFRPSGQVVPLRGEEFRPSSGQAIPLRGDDLRPSSSQYDLPPLPRFDARGRQTAPSLQEDGGDLGSVASNLAQQLSGASQSDRRGQTGDGFRAQAPGQLDGRQSGRRESWSLGDLLARASEPDDQPPIGGQAPRQETNFGSRSPAAANGAGSGLRLDEIARAIDHRTAAEVWQRFRAGERGVFGRHLYSHDGQATFDEIARRYDRDGDFRSTVDRYMADFERLLGEAEQSDPEGRMLQNYLTSETGRVYLLLAHASGHVR